MHDIFDNMIDSKQSVFLYAFLLSELLDNYKISRTLYYESPKGQLVIYLQLKLTVFDKISWLAIICQVTTNNHGGHMID